jgi:hypothetical protein
MIKFKSILSLLVVGMLFSLSSCTEDNPVIVLPDQHLGATDNGNLEVFVRHKTVTGEYFGGVMVKLYLSEVDWQNNAVFRANTTPTTNTTIDGALFDNLDFQRYWISAQYNHQGEDFAGADNVMVPKGTTTQFHLVCQ